MNDVAVSFDTLDLGDFGGEGDVWQEIELLAVAFEVGAVFFGGEEIWRGSAVAVV